MADKTQLFGLEELTANFSAINVQLQAALPNIVMEGAELLEAEIRSRAPVDTGALVASLDVETDHSNDVASATVQIERSTKGENEHYAIFKEFGTSKMAAQPFFRPGVEVAREKVGALMAARVREVVAP